MNYGCTHWLGKLANLNVARTEARGAAPHKPRMLLTVIDLIGRDSVSKAIGLAEGRARQLLAVVEMG